MQTLRVIICLCFFASAFGPQTARTQSQTLDIRPQAHRVMGEGLLEAFKGVTHEGAYNFDHRGLADNTYTETHHDNGQVSYNEGDTSYKGVWLIERNEMCFIYSGDDLGGGCFRVYQVKNCYYFYSSQYRAPENEVETDYWTARSVKKGETPECVMGVV